METTIVTWNDKPLIVAALRKGKVVAFPTETVYGLGVISSSAKAYEALREAKNRPAEKPISLMCSSITQAVMHCEINVGTLGLLQNILPGEATLLLPSRKGIKHHIDLGTGVTGIRIPDSEDVRDIIEAVGQPLLVTSANLAGEPVCKDFEEVKRVFDGRIDMIVVGECRSQTPSTIIDCTKEELSLIRQGSIALEDAKRIHASSKMAVALGSDHGGYLYKKAIRKHLLERGFIVHDYGTKSKASCDYPIFAQKAATAVADGVDDLGILVCTSGEGIAIAANKIPGVRCGIGYDDVATGKTREHNDANMIAFGQAYMKKKDVLRRVDIFLCETFSKLEKHHRRVCEIEK